MAPPEVSSLVASPFSETASGVALPDPSPRLPDAFSLQHPELQLTVVQHTDERDQVTVSVKGVTAVTFYPDPGEHLPPNPLRSYRPTVLTIRCDQWVEWSRGRPRTRTIPASQRRSGNGVNIRVWVTTAAEKEITHPGNVFAANGGTAYRVCAA